MTFYLQSSSGLQQKTLEMQYLNQLQVCDKFLLNKVELVNLNDYEHLI